jgi:prevent-host-death family protein
MQVAVRALKADLSRVLAQAREGEVIEVTSHQRPIARIIGIPPQADEGLLRLMADGALSWGGGKPAFGAAGVLGNPGRTVSEMVLEDRG